MPRSSLLFGDIGGTNIRLAHWHNGQLGPMWQHRSAAFPGLCDAILAFSKATNAQFDGVILAVAGPVAHGEAHLTNLNWTIRTQDIKAVIPDAEVSIVNDFEANAWALDDLDANDLHSIGPAPKTLAGSTKVVLGPGTGLGLAALTGPSHQRLVLRSEGGHRNAAADTAREQAVIEALWQDGQHVSAERLLSGPGIVTIARMLARIDGKPAPTGQPSDIVSMAGKDAICRESLDLFLDMLASFCGDTALTFASDGGVFLAGGILPRLIALIDPVRFRQRFTAKGRFQDFLAAIPVHVIMCPDLAFRGLIKMAGVSSA